MIDDASSIFPWMSLTMALGFTLGAALLVNTSYPENPITTLAWDSVIGPLFSCESKTGAGFQDDMAMETPIPPTNTRAMSLV